MDASFVYMINNTVGVSFVLGFELDSLLLQHMSTREHQRSTVSFSSLLRRYGQSCHQLLEHLWSSSKVLFLLLHKQSCMMLFFFTGDIDYIFFFLCWWIKLSINTPSTPSQSWQASTFHLLSFFWGGASTPSFFIISWCISPGLL